MKIGKKHIIIFAAIIISIAIIAVYMSIAKSDNSATRSTDKKPISNEDFLILRFEANNFLITSNPIEADSLIALTQGKAKLDSQCETLWPPVEMVKQFDNGHYSHVYLIKTKEACSAGIPIEKFIEYYK